MSIQFLRTDNCNITFLERWTVRGPRSKFEVWLAVWILASHVVGQQSSVPIAKTQKSSMRPDLWLSQTIDVHGTKERRRICTLHQKAHSQDSQHI